MRFYERAGLLPKPARTTANYRLYPEETVTRIHFIRRAQQLGFTLKEIKDCWSCASVGEPRARKSGRTLKAR